MSSRNVKRYHGKKANVVNNMFFEEYMQVVAKGMFSCFTLSIYTYIFITKISQR